MVIKRTNSRKGSVLTLAPDWARIRLDAMKTLAEIGAALRRERLNQRISRDALAARAGVSKRTISRVETGRSVASELLFSLVGALGLSLAQPASHFVIVARRIDSSRWVRVGMASAEADGVIRASMPLVDRTLFLVPVASAADAEAWPYEVGRETVFPKQEGL